MPAIFDNRMQAAEELAAHLAYLAPKKPVVLAVSPGGAPVAEVVAKHLEVPCDILVIEKIGSPKRPDQTVGAVDEHGRISVIQDAQRWHHVSARELIEPARVAFRGIADRVAEVRAVLPEIDVRGQAVILIADGIDAGARMLGAVASVRDRGATEVIVAAPAGREQAIWQLHDTADIVVIPHRPAKFKGIEEFYKDYEEVSRPLLSVILERWASERVRQPVGVHTAKFRFVSPFQTALHCELDLPPGMTRGSGPYAAVVFVHGFESDGHSPRNIPISRRLAKRGVIGVRLDLTGHGRSEGQVEECTQERMLIDLQCALDNIAVMAEIDVTRIGLIGSGTGAIVVLEYAAREPRVAALVIRGPITGGEVEAARRVTAPTLIIHAERDTGLDAAVRSLDAAIGAEHDLLTIPESNRLFGDPISRELMVNGTVSWLADHLGGCPTPPGGGEEGE